MLKGSREVIIRKIQPLTFHGQLALDLYFVDADDQQGHTHVARVGPEAVPRHLQPGDRVKLDYLVGVVTHVTKLNA
jgi:hypothetical protein